MSDRPTSAKSLLNTRWFFWVEPGDAHHVEVASVRGRQATVATCYSTPFRAWDVPVAAILTEPGAFKYLGTAEEFSWVRPRAVIVAVKTRHPRTPRPFTGLWEIEDLSNNSVRLGTLPEEGPRGPRSFGENIHWVEFLEYTRQPTNVERQSWFEQSQLYARVWERLPLNEMAQGPEPPPPAPAPAPETPPEPGPRGPARWDRLAAHEPFEESDA